MSSRPLTRLREQGGFYALGPRTCLRITGADRQRYLNGQVSNDLGKLEAGEALPALVMTAKGKLCADIFLWSGEDALWIDADPALAEPLAARLERYAIADDVQFELTEPRARYHAFGPTVPLPSGLRIQRLGVEGVDLDPPPPGLAEASAEEIECLRIERGIPRWGAELDENTLPQEARLEQSHVDFHKGCYVGQEVVSRLQSVGRPNRLLAGFRGDFEAAEARGALLRTPTDDQVGVLTSTIRHPETGESLALGYVHRRAEGRSFSVWNESGACLGGAERSQFPLLA